MRGFRLWAWAFAISPLKNYPGCQTADSWDTIKQALGTAELSNWMPFFYTCLVSPFVWFGEAVGSISKGFFLFTLVQIAFAAAVLSYTCYWLRERRAPKLVAGAVFCLYALERRCARKAAGCVRGAVAREAPRRRAEAGPAARRHAKGSDWMAIIPRLLAREAPRRRANRTMVP